MWKILGMWYWKFIQMNGVADLGLESDLVIESFYFLLWHCYFFQYDHFTWDKTDSFHFSFLVGNIIAFSTASHVNTSFQKYTCACMCMYIYTIPNNIILPAGAKGMPLFSLLFLIRNETWFISFYHGF